MNIICRKIRIGRENCEFFSHINFIGAQYRAKYLSIVISPYKTFSHKKRAHMFPSRNGVKVHESCVCVSFVYTSLAQAHQENIFADFLGKLIFKENYSKFQQLSTAYRTPFRSIGGEKMGRTNLHSVPGVQDVPRRNRRQVIGPPISCISPNISLFLYMWYT